MRLPSMCPSRMRNAAAASEARPAPTRYADFSSTPFGLRGRANHILATPTLIKLSPAPVRKIIGDLGEEAKVLLALGLQQGTT